MRPIFFKLLFLSTVLNILEKKNIFFKAKIKNALTNTDIIKQKMQALPFIPFLVLSRFLILNISELYTIERNKV